MEEVPFELDPEGPIESQWIEKGITGILEGGQNTGENTETENAFLMQETTSSEGLQ